MPIAGSVVSAVCCSTASCTRPNWRATARNHDLFPRLLTTGSSTVRAGDGACSAEAGSLTSAAEASVVSWRPAPRETTDSSSTGATSSSGRVHQRVTSTAGAASTGSWNDVSAGAGSSSTTGSSNHGSTSGGCSNSGDSNTIVGSNTGGSKTDDSNTVCSKAGSSTGSWTSCAGESIISISPCSIATGSISTGWIAAHSIST